jgi:protein-tyrosine phosphatase
LPQQLSFTSLHNLRDVGGARTQDGGRVADGRLYRSDLLARLTAEELPAFLALGVNPVIDLRYDWEIAADGRFPATAGISWHNLSIEHRPYDQAGLSPEIDPVEFLAARFAEVADDGAVEIRTALDLLARADTYPVVVHCTSGRDRTGLLVALVLSLIGVTRADVLADFALTNQATERLRQEWRDSHAGRDLSWPAYGSTPPELMARVLDDLASTHSSVQAYARDHLGVDDGTIASLGEQLVLDRAPPPFHP